jgi:UDP-N-acetylglucosamine 2-epimerase (non-hydrolysing)
VTQVHLRNEAEQLPHRKLKLLLVAGARPNFMKIAPLVKAVLRHNQVRRDGEAEIEYRLVHTGQHYDEKMSWIFFGELGIPLPDINLGVGSGSHALQTAHIMEKFEPVLLNAFGSPTSVGSGSTSASVDSTSSLDPSPRPDWVIVVGDVNSTMACTLVASKLGIKVAHVEAGLRSYDRTMPEEINRIVTDSLADLLLTPSEDANENLRREGVPDHKIHLVGNIMIDALVANLEKARQRDTLRSSGLNTKSFAYVTLHRPSNVDQRDSLASIMAELMRLSRRMPVVFPMHPRTRKMLSEFGLSLENCPGLRILEPIGYHDSLYLTEHARFVLTDSGGLQEESTYFRTPCLTLRPNTERPVTITLGSNRLTTVQTLASDLDEVLGTERRTGNVPPMWDGHTAERIVHALLRRSGKDT